MTTTEPTRHLDDGALVRLLDGEPGFEAERAHVEACESCAHRLDVLRRRSASLSRRLARVPTGAPPTDLWDRIQAASARMDHETVDHGAAVPSHGTPAPGPHRTSPALRAAAVVALLLGGALAAQPVRAWLGEALHDLAVAAGLVAPAPAPEATPEGDVEVAIVPRGDRLVLRFDTRPPDRAVWIRFEDRTDAVGRVPASGFGAELVALPDGFRIRGGDASGLRFAVPADLTVELRFPGAPPTDMTGAAGEARRVPE